MAEDCLILNIFAPSQTVITEQGAVPVMVFIHGELLAHFRITGLGGSFYRGTANVYNGVPLVIAEDVVVVAINYRLGALGFIYLPVIN